MLYGTSAPRSGRPGGTVADRTAPLPKVAPVEALPPAPLLPRIKVLYVVTRFGAGAGDTTLLAAEGTDPDRYEVWVAGAPGGDLWEPARAAGVRTLGTPGFRHALGPADVLVLGRLLRLIRRERFTVVHTHSPKGGSLGRVAARLCRAPVVVHTLHGLSFHPYTARPGHPAHRALEHVTRRLAHRFPALAPRVPRTAGAGEPVAPPHRGEVPPAAVRPGDTPVTFDPAARERLGVPREAALVGTVGSAGTRNNSLAFVRMAAAVRAEHPDTAFVMIGDGPPAEEVRRLAADLGVEVTLTGPRPDADRLVAGLDVFVTTSLYEGPGRALTRALAAARPVVATAVSGVPDLVEHGATGLLVAPADPAATARAVGWLLDHPREATEMGRQGSRRVRGPVVSEPAVTSEARPGPESRLAPDAPVAPGSPLASEGRPAHETSFADESSSAPDPARTPDTARAPGTPRGAVRARRRGRTGLPGGGRVPEGAARP
ncbi:glycosyltransferase family 4 protein [Streptomyces sp. NPDC056738]|uniref:glycosyltransferase family 4 protein n=1 Tax=Streptomyces sp. NPDC056738 TaxID=3345933 RepID=UPI0036BD0B6A